MALHITPRLRLGGKRDIPTAASATTTADVEGEKIDQAVRMIVP